MVAPPQMGTRAPGSARRVHARASGRRHSPHRRVPMEAAPRASSGLRDVPVPVPGCWTEAAAVLLAWRTRGCAHRRCGKTRMPLVGGFTSLKSSPSPVRTRPPDLLSRLSTEEKIGFLTNTALGVPRLAIPAYQWCVPESPLCTSARLCVCAHPPRGRLVLVLPGGMRRFTGWLCLRVSCSRRRRQQQRRFLKSLVPRAASTAACGVPSGQL